MTIVRLHDFVKVSISAEFKSFLLIMCTDAPESTTNSRSSGLRFDGANRHLFSEDEKNAASFSPLIFTKYCWPASTLLHGHIALATLSLPETDPQILEHWVALMRFTWANHSERRILVSNVSTTAFVNLTHRNWFPYV